MDDLPEDKSRKPNDSMNPKKRGRYVPSRYLSTKPNVKDVKNIAANISTVKKDVSRPSTRPHSSMTSSMSETSLTSFTRGITASSSIISIATSPTKKEFARNFNSKANLANKPLKDVSIIRSEDPQLQLDHKTHQISPKSKKVPGKVEPTKEQLKEAAYSRYLQYVYLDALAENTSQIHEKQAMEQISKMRALALEVRKEKMDLERENTQSLNKNILKSLVNTLNDSLEPIISKLDPALKSLSCMANNLDAARNSMKIDGIYLPPDDDSRRSYYDEIINELKESESLMEKILNLTTNSSSIIGGSSTKMKEMINFSEKGIKEKERCETLLDEVAKCTLEESYLKQALLNE